MPRVDTLDRILRAGATPRTSTSRGAPMRPTPNGGRRATSCCRRSSWQPCSRRATRPACGFSRFPRRQGVSGRAAPASPRRCCDSRTPPTRHRPCLRWCARGGVVHEQARGTIDLDVNVFVGPERTDDTLAALPAGVVATHGGPCAASRDGQARLWWGTTPIDVFLNTTDVPPAGRSPRALGAVRRPRAAVSRL